MDTSITQQALRQEAIRRRLQGESRCDICRALQRSRSWFDKWWADDRRNPQTDFSDHSRAPHTSPHQTPVTVECAVIEIRPAPSPAPVQGLEPLQQQANSAAALQRATATLPDKPRPSDALALQRTVGNRAVTRMLAAVGQQATTSTSRFPRQTKLTVGPVGDTYEQEADRVAQQVMSQLSHPAGQPDRSVQRAKAPEADEELRMKPLAAAVTPLVQRMAGAAGGPVTPDVEESIQQARGSGQPLAETVRGPMEQAFGADVSGVTVHADAESDTLNRTLQAHAFTTGQDLFFRRGEYNPGSSSSQELIAHELTHVVQQGDSQAQRAEPEQARGEQEIVAQAASGLQQNGETAQRLSSAGIPHLQRAGDPLGMMKEHAASNMTNHHIIPENKLHDFWAKLKPEHFGPLAAGIRSLVRQGFNQLRSAARQNLKKSLKYWSDVGDYGNQWEDDTVLDKMVNDLLAGSTAAVVLDTYLKPPPPDNHARRELLKILPKLVKAASGTAGTPVSETTVSQAETDEAKKVVSHLLMWMPGNIHVGPSKRLTKKSNPDQMDPDIRQNEPQRDQQEAVGRVGRAC